jgi:hypothetical protein
MACKRIFRFGLLICHHQLTPTTSYRSDEHQQSDTVIKEKLTFTIRLAFMASIRACSLAEDMAASKIKQWTWGRRTAFKGKKKPGVQI